MAKKAKFEVYKSKKDNKFYGRLKARNGEIVAVSEGYERLSGASKWRRNLFNWASEAFQTCRTEVTETVEE